MTLRLYGYDVTTAERGDEAIDVLGRRRFDVVLLDLYMKPVSGMDVLRAAVAANRETLVVLMTGNPSVTSNLEALGAGAWDYLPKPFTATHLQLLLGRAAHMATLARESRAAHATLVQRHGNSDKLTLLGVSPAFREAVELARKVASTDASVMLTGESGTGKELVAQFIHAQSRRAQRDMVSLNCAAIPEPLLESEMFGHRKGAFTGADREKPGLLEMANGTTMFLDELTDMPHATQAKLLRVLQDGVVRRVGSERPDTVVDVRFISATNRDPQEAVRAGALRGDLCYRLRVVSITIPPLRDRPEDIPLLASHFLASYWQRHRRATEAVPQLTKAALDFLCAHVWNGNVRELQNVIEHVTVVADPGQQIRPEHIVIHGDTGGAAGATAPTRGVLEQTYHTAKDAVILEFEKAYLSRLVSRARGNISRAARLACVDRMTLYRLIERHPGAVADRLPSMWANDSTLEPPGA
jgi:DNA-binding NtrC family response regulator